MSPQCLLTPFTTTLLAKDRVPAAISFSFVDFHTDVMKYLLVQTQCGASCQWDVGGFVGLSRAGLCAAPSVVVASA